MIHEFLTIEKNIVHMTSDESSTNSNNSGNKNSQIIVSDENDPFYKESMYLNYGDLTDKFQNMWKNINQKLNNRQLII